MFFVPEECVITSPAKLFSVVYLLAILERYLYDDFWRRKGGTSVSPTPTSPPLLYSLGGLVVMLAMDREDRAQQSPRGQSHELSSAHWLHSIERTLKTLVLG